MSTNEWEYDEDEFNPGETPGPKQLREALKKEKAERRQLEEQLKQIQRDLRQRTVKETLASRGVNPKIAAFIPTDVEGDEAIGKWLEEYADVFGVTAPQSAASDAASVNDAGEVIEFQRAQAAAQGSAPQPGGDLLERIAHAKNAEEVASIIGAAGLG